MIVFNGMDLIWLAIGAVFLIICGIILVIARIAYAIKKRQQKRIKKDLREVCREKYGDDFVEMYDMVNSGVPIGNLEETQIFLAMVEAAEDGE